jgi:pimeloyl-ACP methyl ester carboxylesterase
MANAALPSGCESLRLPGKDVGLYAVAAGPTDGPLVILLHGFPEFWYGWRHQIAALAAAEYRVVVPDQRGYNLSDKPTGAGAYRLDALADDVIALADVLGRERFAVVGHDWGAVVAWHLAGRNPDRIARAAALNGPHPATLWSYARRHPRQALKSWYVGFFQLPLLPEAALRAGGFAMLRRTLTQSAREGVFAGADWPAYLAAWQQPGALTAMLNWYRALPASFRPPSFGLVRPRRIVVPMQIIWGDRDAFLEPGLAEAGAALCERAETFHLPDATHWVQHEASARVNQLLTEFLGRTG